MYRPKHLKKINWGKGSAELIGFCLTLPAVCLILFSLVYIMQIGLLRQSLEYATYIGSRAAVVCSTETEALTQARNAVEMTLAADHVIGGFDQDNILVEIELVGGTSDATAGGIRWEKGALMKCQVSVPYKLFSDEMGGSENTMVSTLYVMVEQPARTY